MFLPPPPPLLLLLVPCARSLLGSRELGLRRPALSLLLGRPPRLPGRSSRLMGL